MTDTPAPALRLPASPVVTWVLVAVGAVIVGLLSPLDEALSWLQIVLALGIILTFCIQLGIVRKEGLVNRIILSISGSVIILGIATLVLGLMYLASR